MINDDLFVIGIGTQFDDPNPSVSTSDRQTRSFAIIGPPGHRQHQQVAGTHWQSPTSTMPDSDGTLL